MYRRLIFALFLATAAVGPASAQQSQTQAASDDSQSDLIWNLVGCLGLIGLIGLLPQHEDDSYHPSAFDE